MKIADVVRNLIETKNVQGLEALQIHGAYGPSDNAVGTDYTGYDYDNQCWITHSFIWNYGMDA
jgi:hypothetical protein